MSSNKVKRGWKKTYEKNDSDKWNQTKHHIIKNTNGQLAHDNDESLDKARPRKKFKK